MSRSDQTGKSDTHESSSRDRRFHTLVDSKSIDLRLIAAQSLGWPLAQIPSIWLGGVEDFQHLVTMFGSLIVGHVVFAALLFFGKLTFWRTRFMQRHHSLALWLLFLNTLVGSIASHAVLSAARPQAMFDLETVLLRFVLLSAIFSAVTQIRTFRSLVKDLEQKQAEHRVLIEQAKSEAFAERELVRDRLASIRAEVSQYSKLAVSELVSRLRVLSEDVIRPWSHDLARDVPNIFVPKVRRPWPRWQTVLNHAFTQRVIRPVPIAALISIFSISYSVRVTRGDPGGFELPESGPGLNVVFDAQSFIEFLLQIATIFLSTYLAAILINKLGSSAWFEKLIPTIAIRALSQLMLLTVLAMFLLGVLFSALDLVGGGPPTVGFLFLQAFPVLIIGALATLVFAIRQLKDSIVQELENLNDELKSELAAQNQQLLLVRKELSNALHGPVRAALLSAAFSLNQKENTKEEQIQNLLNRLEDGSLLIPATAPKDAMAQINQTFELWRDSCQIVVGISVGAKDGLDRSVSAASFLSQVLSESITNAIVHGGAGYIKVEIAEKQGNIHLLVTDDGKLLEPLTPGLGSQLMDRLTLNWSISATEHGTRLDAVFPLKH